MGNKVNPTAFRLGINTFWKTELFPHKYSTLFREFFNIFRILKLAMRGLNLELISLKIKTVENLKVLAWARVFSWSLMFKLWKPWKGKKRRRHQIFSPKGKRKVGLMRSSGFAKFESQIFNKEFLQFFKLNSDLFLKVDNIYLKACSSKNQPKVSHRQIGNYAYTFGKAVYKRSKRDYKVRWFKFLKDTIQVTNLSLLLVKSELLSYFLAKLVKSHKKIKWVAKKVRACMKSFSYFYHLGVAARISICGKQKAVGRSRTYSFGYGKGWPMQSPSTRLSYTLTQTWNVFGAFGVKVWVFNHQTSKGVGYPWKKHNVS